LFGNSFHQEQSMRTITVVLLSALLATAALARQNDRGPRVRDAREARGVEVVVRAGGVNVTVQNTIRTYYADKPKKARGLPPGAARNYARGKRLPPGIAKQALPPDLERRLTVPPGHQYIVVDSDVLLVAVSTGIVVDILLDVL
jgi:Ni/Co efflux regulator RcnB